MKKRIAACLLAAVLVLTCAASALAANWQDRPTVTVSLEDPANGMTVSEVLTFLEITDGGSIAQDVSAQAPLAGTDIAGTGMIVHYPGGTSSAYLAVRGDVTGSGKIGLTQLVRLGAAAVRLSPLRGPFEIAGDLNEDGKITLSDLVAEAALVLRASMQVPEVSAPPADVEAARQEIVAYIQKIRSDDGLSAFDADARTMSVAQEIANIRAQSVFSYPQSILYKMDQIGSTYISSLEVPLSSKLTTLSEVTAAIKEDIDKYWKIILLAQDNGANVKLGVGIAFNEDAKCWLYDLELVKGPSSRS